MNKIIRGPDEQRLDFDPPHARKTDPATSRSAALRVKTGSVRHRILNSMESYFAAHPLTRTAGITTVALAIQMGVGRDSVSPHMKPLKAMGYVVETGHLIVNQVTNNKCIGWRLTDKYYSSNLKRTATPAPSTCCPMCHRPIL